MPKTAPLVESFGTLNLLIGGKHGYIGVRKVRDDFQGYTPKKNHTTKAYKSEHEAAVARALLKKDIESGMIDTAEKQPRAKRVLARAPPCLRHMPGAPPLIFFVACAAAEPTHGKLALSTPPERLALGGAIEPRAVWAMPLTAYQASWLVARGSARVPAMPLARPTWAV